MDENYDSTEIIFLNESVLFNVTDEDAKISKFVLQNWIINLYFAFISLGSLANLIYILALVRCRRSGILSLVMQLCAIDVLSPCAAAIEILTLNNQTWSFPPEICPLYNGIEILANSLTIWFMICLNFQIVSLWNLHKKETKKNGRNPLTSCDDEFNECLVTKKENTNRVLNIDYRKRKNDVSVIIPTILIWFFCVSLSIPNFTLSSTLKMKPNHTICAIVDHFYGYILQILLLVFRVLLPTPLLLFSLIILTVKLSKASPKIIDNIITKEFAEIRSLLVYCISLTILYLITSFQRNLFHLLHIKSHNFSDHTAKVFKVPPLYINQLGVFTSISLSMLHYSSNTFRAILCLFLLPKFRELVKSKVFVCCKSEK